MADKKAILKRRKAGLTFAEIASELNTTVGTVAGVVKRHKDKQTTPQNVVAFPSLPKPQLVYRPENEGNDMAQWESERDKLLKKNDFVRVMHMNDLHLPYHDSQALSLWLSVANLFQPQIVVLGSDTLDLPTISAFEADHDISTDDWQEQSREFYWPIVHKLDKLLPNAVFVWIYGNHERRALKAIKSSDSPKIGMRYFIETVNCGGRVLHIGRTEHVEIGGLVVAHGNKAGKYAADKIGALWPSKTVNFGHIHKHQAFGNAFSNGMLCQKIAHYEDWQYPTTQEQGTSTMTVDTLPFGGVSWSHHSFVEKDGMLWVQYGDKVLSVDKEMEAVRKSA